MQGLYFTLGKENAKELRMSIVKTKTVDEIRKIMYKS
jgi:hypothetical protein